MDIEWNSAENQPDVGYKPFYGEPIVCPTCGQEHMWWRKSDRTSGKVASWWCADCRTRISHDALMKERKATD